MKVLMFNGSPKAKGCTYTALEEMAKVLNEEGIETEIFQAGDPSQEKYLDPPGRGQRGSGVGDLRREPAEAQLQPSGSFSGHDGIPEGEDRDLF